MYETRTYELHSASDNVVYIVLCSFSIELSDLTQVLMHVVPGSSQKMKLDQFLFFFIFFRQFQIVLLVEVGRIVDVRAFM